MDHTLGVAVVTGAAGAIGTALTATLTDAGYDVVGLDLPAACPPERLASGAMVGCDITDDAEVRAVFERIVADHGRIDLLVNNAAIFHPFLVEDATVHQVEQHVAVNLMGPIWCIRAAIPHLRKSQGQIVTMDGGAKQSTNADFGEGGRGTKAAQTDTGGVAEGRTSLNLIRGPGLD